MASDLKKGIAANSPGPIQISENHLLAFIGDLSENPNAKRYAGEWGE